MKPTKVFLKQAILLLAIFIFLLPVLSHAQVKEIISEGAYNMGDGETPGVAESRALLQAKRIALEKAGTYVESYSKVINLQLTEDEIQVLASGIMEVEILDKKRTVVGGGIHFWVKIKAKVNLDKTEELANRIKAKDKSLVEDYKKIQEAYNKSQKDIEELKKQLAQATGEKEKKKVEAQITDEERLFQANEWIEKGARYYLKHEYDNAIEALTKAISLDPNSKRAYFSRAFIYSAMGEHDRAIEDLNKVLSLDPNDFNAYSNRGGLYSYFKNYEKAIEDLNKAITFLLDDSKIVPYLNQNFPQQKIDFSQQKMFIQLALFTAYTNRGNTYNAMGLYDRAIEDYSMVIAIYHDIGAYFLYFNKEQYTDAYFNRGNTYGKKGQHDRAIEDYNKAIVLNPNDARVYYNRGVVYGRYKEQYDRAIEDFNKAIAINPNDAEAHTSRGVAYYMKGIIGRAISDWQKACDMGNEKGCKNLQKALERGR